MNYPAIIALLTISGCAAPEPRAKVALPPLPPRMVVSAPAAPIKPVPSKRYVLTWTATFEGLPAPLPHPRLEFDIERTQDFRHWTLYARTNQPPVEIVPGFYRVGVHTKENE